MLLPYSKPNNNASNNKNNKDREISRSQCRISARSTTPTTIPPSFPKNAITTNMSSQIANSSRKTTNDSKSTQISRPTSAKTLTKDSSSSHHLQVPEHWGRRAVNSQVRRRLDHLGRSHRTRIRGDRAISSSNSPANKARNSPTGLRTGIQCRKTKAFWIGIRTQVSAP